MSLPDESHVLVIDQIRLTDVTRYHNISNTQFTLPQATRLSSARRVGQCEL